MMEGKVALVTGIEGFTGRYVAAELASLGYDVHGLARSGSDTHRQSVVDLCDRARLHEVIASMRPAVVVHLAGISNVVHSDVQELYRSNIVGTRNLLEALAGMSEPPDSVLLASSAHVYGPASQSLLTEASPFAPHNDYAVSKVAMEYMAALWFDRLPITTIRPFNYTGVGQSSAFLIPKIVDAARRGDGSITLGNLDVARDFADVRDIAACYARLVERRVVGETVNVCTGVTTSLREVVDTVSSLAGTEFEIRTHPDLVRANEVKCLRGSNRHLIELIGEFRFRPLRETLAWMLEQPADG